MLKKGVNLLKREESWSCFTVPFVCMSSQTWDIFLKIILEMWHKMFFISHTVCLEETCSRIKK